MINMKTRADAAVILAGALAALIGALATLGYAFAAGALLQPFHGATPMVLLVALCIVVGGAALVLEGSGAAFPKALLTVGAVMAATSVIATIQWGLGQNTGIDLPTLERGLGIAGMSPRRPSPTCCVCLLLLGAAIGGLPFAANRRITFGLATLATIGGALVFWRKKSGTDTE